VATIEKRQKSVRISVQKRLVNIIPKNFFDA
jgi:hypothetical protein